MFVQFNNQDINSFRALRITLFVAMGLSCSLSSHEGIEPSQDPNQLVHINAENL